MDDYTAAIGVQPDFEVPYYNRGLILYRLGKPPFLPGSLVVLAEWRAPEGCKTNVVIVKS